VSPTVNVSNAPNCSQGRAKPVTFWDLQLPPVETRQLEIRPVQPLSIAPVSAPAHAFKAHQQALASNVGPGIKNPGHTSKARRILMPLIGGKQQNRDFSFCQPRRLGQPPQRAGVPCLSSRLLAYSVIHKHVSGSDSVITKQEPCPTSVEMSRIHLTLSNGFSAVACSITRLLKLQPGEGDPADYGPIWNAQDPPASAAFRLSARTRASPIWQPSALATGFRCTGRMRSKTTSHYFSRFHLLPASAAVRQPTALEIAGQHMPEASECHVEPVG